MKTLWNFIFMASIVFIFSFEVHAQHKSEAPELPEPPIAKTWKESKEALNKLAEKFRDAKLTKAQKIAYLPNSNNLLYDTLELKLSQVQKKEQIEVIVNFIAATFETDFANSNLDSILEDFKSNKKAYTAEIKKISNKKLSEEILETLDDLEKSEKDTARSDSDEGADEAATVKEQKH